MNSNSFSPASSSITILHERAEQAAQLMNRFCSLLLEQQRQAWLDLFDEDVIFEFPYAHTLDNPRLEGKQALAQHMLYFDTIISMQHMSQPLIHQTLNPHIFIAQFHGRGQLLQSGHVYDQHYISVVEVKDGRILRYEDYWNPLAIDVSS
ncbi:nuclear transport factor 2 family protein [Paenibacillus sp. WLX1005]|uniref:nuclear transport factor 2 family protein n=1 Tax=unclassified Paenibacillus TaxID=185978 RepID=UPI0039845C49